MSTTSRFGVVSPFVTLYPNSHARELSLVGYEEQYTERLWHDSKTHVDNRYGRGTTNSPFTSFFYAYPPFVTTDEI